MKESAGSGRCLRRRGWRRGRARGRPFYMDKYSRFEASKDTIADRKKVFDIDSYVFLSKPVIYL
jgi:hypothetical protein